MAFASSEIAASPAFAPCRRFGCSGRSVFPTPKPRQRTQRQFESCADFEDFWRALGRQVGPAGAWLHGLDDHQRALAHPELRRQLGRRTGGFELHARAYCTRGTRLPDR